MIRRALVVDDNRALAEDLGEILGSEGYEVYVYDDPVRALGECATLEFEVALLDVRMPRLDGISLHRRLMESHPDTRFVLMTAYTEDERIVQALNAGVCAVLNKPVSLRDLLPAIEVAIETQNRAVLLVEDDPKFAEALSEVLRDCGYRVEHVSSLAAARASGGSTALTAIIDVCLPDGRGTELAGELTRAGLSIVLITGLDPDEPSREIEQLGVHAHVLTKPFAPEALLKLLAEQRRVSQ